MRYLLPAVLLLLIAVRCSPDETEQPVPSDPRSGGSDPSDELQQELAALPLFPKAVLTDGRYSIGRTRGLDLQTGFAVVPGTTPEEVTDFFALALPPDNWAVERQPKIVSSTKAGSVATTVAMTFLKGDLRLTIIIPLTHKDAPDGVTVVELALAPKEFDYLATPIYTPIDATPIRTAPRIEPTVSFATSPGDGRSASPAPKESPSP